MKMVILAAAAVVAVALIVGIGLSAPVEYRVGSEALGTWSAPVHVSTEGLSLVDSCEQALYADGQYYGMIVSPDEGATWGSPALFYGTLDVDNFVLYRVNFSEEPMSMDMFFSRSLDNGTGWIEYSYVMTPDGGSDGAYRVIKVGPVVLFYAYINAGGEGWINYSRSVDGGLTWSDQAYIDDKVHVEDPEPADIVSCGGKLFLAYYHYDTIPIDFTNVVVKESDDLGATWTNRQVVGDGFLPVLKEDSGNLYITYWSNDGLMFTMSDDVGVSWTTPLLIGAIQGYTDASNFHALAVSGSQIFAAYMDYDFGGTPEYILHINYSDDGGSSWTDLGEVTGSGTSAYGPSLLISNGKLHFMYIDVDSVYPTCYRWLLLDEPIPEFGIAFAPILATMALIVLISRRH